VPAHAQKDTLPPEITAPFPSIAFDGLKLVKGPRDNSFTVSNITFGMENQVNLGTASGGAGAGKANFTKMTFQRTPDANSAELIRALVTGKNFSRATVRIKGGVVVTLGIVFVTSYQIGGTDAQPTETVTLAFGQLDFRVVSYADRTVIGFPMGWDVLRNSTLKDLKVDEMPVQK
jgi:type VI protein secretion system component Hcp